MKKIVYLWLLLLLGSCASPITEYIMSTQPDEVKAILERSPKSANEKDVTLEAYPLETAILFINLDKGLETFKILLDNGARFDEFIENGKPISAMEMIAKYHNIEAMQALIDKGEKRRSALTLHNALKCEKAYNSKQKLVGSKMIHTRDELGFIKWVLENGWDVNAKLEDGTTPVMTAIEHCSLDIVKYLVSKGAKLKEKNDKGYDALYFAARSKSSDTLKYLLKLGFKVKDKKYQKTNINLLHVITSNQDYAYLSKVVLERVKMIVILVKQGVDINEKQQVYFYTPLAWAVSNVIPEYVDKLIELGADRNTLTNNGETLLDLAVKHGRSDSSEGAKIVSVLEASGGSYKRYKPKSKTRVVKKQDDDAFWAVLGGVTTSAVGFKSGLSEAAAIDAGTRMAKDIKDDNVSINNFKANQSLASKKTSTPNSKIKVANKDFNVDKNARAQYAGNYANTYFDKAVADYRYELNSNGSAKLFVRVCETCTHDLQGKQMSRDWKESYQAIEWAPMLDDKNKPLTVQVKDMYDKSYQARILLVTLQGGETMTLKHYSDSKGAALLGSYGVALYKN